MLKPISKSLTLWLILSFIIVLPLSSSQLSCTEYTIYTRIINIDHPPTPNYYVYLPNQTFFEFEGTAEIINTYDLPLTIISSTTNLVFYSGELHFENESCSGDVWGAREAGNAFTHHTFEPGITEGSIWFEISVNETLDSIPNGNFTIWLIFDDAYDEHEYVHYKATIFVNNSNITITYEDGDLVCICPTSPTQTTAIGNFLPILLTGFIVLILVRRRFNRFKSFII